MPTELYLLRKRLENRGIFFSFCGPMSQDLLVEIGEVLKHKMKLKEAQDALILRVFSVVVELAQNIIHYSAEKSTISDQPSRGNDISHGIIAVGYKSDHYFVMGGNCVRNGQVKPLQDRLSAIIQMNKEELKENYRKQRRSGPAEGSKGAGLGLLEMAKKANKPIEFEFEKIDNDHSFFSLKIVL